MKLRIDLPEKVRYILEKLCENNYDAYVVGGCVRDSIIGRAPGDWDITTNALPDEIRRIFTDKNTIPTGIKYGTMTVLVGREPFEVTTYRIDLKYSDGRRPDEVRFTSSIEEELGRRDFTVNALAYNEKSGLIDLFNGCQDIEKRIIKCVGNPALRFREDSLRMMRAVRFAAQLGFEIEGETLDAISENKEMLGRVSSERINIELAKTLLSKNPSRIELFYSSGLMEYIIPESQKTYGLPHGRGILEDALKIIEKVEPALHLRMAVLLYSLIPGCSFETARHILKRLKYDNSTIYGTSDLIRNYTLPAGCDRITVKRCLRDMGLRVFQDVLKIQRAYIYAGVPWGLGGGELESMEKMLGEIIDLGECYTIQCLDLDGNDLAAMGIKGREIGHILDLLLDKVIEKPNLNAKDKLIEIAENLYSEYHRD